MLQEQCTGLAAVDVLVCEWALFSAPLMGVGRQGSIRETAWTSAIVEALVFPGSVRK
jgi:hypothetical protein